MRPRPKGKVVYRSPENPFIAEAEKSQRKERLRLQTQRAERRERPVPNYICYPELFKGFDPKTHRGGPCPLPKCKRCEGFLYPMENHVCPGFTPKYVEHDDDWRERQEVRREEIREAKRQRQSHECNWCGEELEDYDAYDAHMSKGCPGIP